MSETRSHLAQPSNSSVSILQSAARLRAIKEQSYAVDGLSVQLGWIATAGADPLALLGQLKGRVLSLHVKDVAADNQQGFDLAMSPSEVGSGTIDWAAVLPAAEAAGVEHYFVEQEAPFAMPREEAMAKSATYLKALVA